ncbi:MAG TPA: GlsB/YeaQ/YmgE family stress response membrane protein [Micropepsaceae bacterium]|nr:GlsB/YeaQ/YmgE family stress response membrane protein [Micropepsaceae bacterium]
MMSLVGWILFGLITGFVGSRVVNRRGEGCVLNVALGIVGACVGGFIFTSIGGYGITGFNLYSMFVAIIGAIVVLLLYHALTGRSGLR